MLVVSSLKNNKNISLLPSSPQIFKYKHMKNFTITVTASNETVKLEKGSLIATAKVLRKRKQNKKKDIVCRYKT